MPRMEESAAVAHEAPVDPLGIDDLATSFAAFVEQESTRFHGALRLLTRNRAEAEDLMQEALLKVWERWERVRTLDDPTGYLYRTAMNLYRQRLRRARLAIRHTITRSSRDELEEVESRDQVLRALATLSPRQRMSLVLTDLLDRSSEEAGELMGIKASTVRVLASQGRAALRDRVGGEVDA